MLVCTNDDKAIIFDFINTRQKACDQTIITYIAVAVKHVKRYVCVVPLAFLSTYLHKSTVWLVLRAYRNLCAFCTISDTTSIFLW